MSSVAAKSSAVRFFFFFFLRARHLIIMNYYELEMTELSSHLSAETKKYAKNTKNLNLQLLYRKYGPAAIVGFVVLLVLYLRWAYF